MERLTERERNIDGTGVAKEEITDVLICIEMLKQMYMISEDKINKWIEKKQAK